MQMQNYYYTGNTKVAKQAEIDVVGGPKLGTWCALPKRRRTKRFWERSVSGGGDYFIDQNLPNMNGIFPTVFVVPCEFIDVDPGVFTVSSSLFERFSELIFEYTLTYPISVSGSGYISFRPCFFEELMDEENSVFRLSKSGDLIMPKRLVLRQPPSREMPIFGFGVSRKRKAFHSGISTIQGSLRSTRVFRPIVSTRLGGLESRSGPPYAGGVIFRPAAPRTRRPASDPVRTLRHGGTHSHGHLAHAAWPR